MGLLEDIERHKKHEPFLIGIWSGIGVLGNAILDWADKQFLKKWVVIAICAWILFLALQAGFITTQDWSDGRVPPIRDDIKELYKKDGRLHLRIRTLEKIHGIKGVK